jgi:hypothetical protein
VAASPGLDASAHQHLAPWCQHTCQRPRRGQSSRSGSPHVHTHPSIKLGKGNKTKRNRYNFRTNSTARALPVRPRLRRSPLGALGGRLATMRSRRRSRSRSSGSCRRYLIHPCHSFYSRGSFPAADSIRKGGAFCGLCFAPGVIVPLICVSRG